MSRLLVAQRALTSPRWTQHRLWRAARAVPSLDLRFADAKSLVDTVTGQSLVTFTRASNATYVDSTGTLRTASTDVPRFDHNPTTGESLGLLVEEQRTNLLPSSVYTSNANGWTNGVIGGTGTIASAVVTNKAGNTNGVFGVTGLDGSSYVGCFVSTASSTSTYTASVFVRNNGGTVFQMRLVNQTGGTFKSSATQYTFATGAWQDGIAGTATPVSRTVQDMGGGWLRFSITAADNGTGNTQTALLLFGGTTTTDYNYYFWGAQLEAGAFPTSYIPTTTATATRSADVATDTTRGAALRSLFAQFRSPASGTRPIVSLDDNTANERIELFTSSTDPKLLVTDGGSVQADIDAGAITANTTARLAARFNTDNFAASVSGGAEVLDATGTMPTVDRIRIGRDQAGNYLNGTIARITGWDAPLNVLPQVTQ